MSQYGSTIASASPHALHVVINTTSATDTSVFKIITSNPQVIVASIDVGDLTYSNSNLSVELLDDLSAILISSLSVSSSEDLQVTSKLQPAGTYYIRVIANDLNAQAITMYSSAIANFRGNRVFKKLTPSGLVLPTALIAVNSVFNGDGVYHARRQGLFGVANTEDPYVGTGVISGTLKVDDVLGRRKVGLYAQKEKILLAQTWSDPVTGYFEFTGYATLAEDPTAKYFIVGHDYMEQETSDVAAHLTAQPV